ncbi:MAG: hypothetical protein MAG451_01730 [Anaerolineales bacterium]|nr:hypothetical protein [Anaerolineales bacterium]
MDDLAIDFPARHATNTDLAGDVRLTRVGALLRHVCPLNNHGHAALDEGIAQLVVAVTPYIWRGVVQAIHEVL